MTREQRLEKALRELIEWAEAADDRIWGEWGTSWERAASEETEEIARAKEALKP